MPGFQFLPSSSRGLCWAALVVLVAAEAAAQTAPGRLVPFRRGSRWGYADHRRRLVLPLAYDDAGPMVNEVAWVRQGALYGYIDGSGTPLTPVQYRAASSFGPDGRATVVLQADTFAIGSDGRRLTTPPDPAPDIDYLEQGDVVRRQSKVGFRFTAGSSTVVPPEYDEIRDLHHDGLLLVRQGAKWGVLNAKGRLTLPLEYDAIRATPANGYAYPVVEQAGRFGYLNADGKLLTPLKYAAAEPFAAGLGRIRTVAGQPGYVDNAGRELWED